MSVNDDQRPAEDDQRLEQDETDPRPDEDLNDAPEDDQEPEGGEVGKLRREAAAHRAKLREAEAERDAVTAQRDVLAAAVLGDALKGTGVAPKLFAAAGRTVEEFITDDGLDRGAITRAARDLRKEYGLSNPAVSRHTGTGDERPEKKKPTWADAVQNG